MRRLSVSAVAMAVAAAAALFACGCAIESVGGDRVGPISNSIEHENLIDFHNPVRSAKEDQVKLVVDSPGKSKMFAGYLKAHEDGELEQFLYYWFIESESDYPEQDPLVLWFNGGPGGSSLALAGTESGPIETIFKDLMLKSKANSWNKLANVLYIEGPIGVGFSYSPTALMNKKRKPLIPFNDTMTADANYLALKSFMKKFPHLADNSLYLTGASYAGIYVPMLADRLDKDDSFNLKGIMIENGQFDYNLQDGSMLLMEYYHGLMSESDWKSISDNCCNGETPSRETCNFDTLYSANNSQCYGTARMIAYQYYANSSGLNPYNIYGGRKTPIRGARELEGRADAITIARDRPRELGCRPLDPEHFFVNQKQLIHVPGEWFPSTGVKYCKESAYQIGGMRQELNSLIRSERNLTILIYNGDTDLACDFLGTRWFIEGLGRRRITDMEPWKNSQGKVVGHVSQYEGLTFATILGAGHSPSAEDPRLVYKMLELFLKSEGKRKVDLANIKI